jgi:hypothetical protein
MVAESEALTKVRISRITFLSEFDFLSLLQVRLHVEATTHLLEPLDVKG